MAGCGDTRVTEVVADHRHISTRLQERDRAAVAPM